jgi:hypothetical protein
MVVVYNFGGRVDTTISRHTKVKGRAETLPLENLIEMKSIPPHLQLTEVSHQSFPLNLL